MKQYRAPSYPKNKERRSKQDRRQDSLSNALQPLALAFMNYLEITSEKLERKVDAELKTADAMMKFAESLDNFKVHIPELPTQPPMRIRKKHKRSANKHHGKVKQIILKMRKANNTFQEIAAHLESEGISTFSGRGRWCAQTVHRLYEGYVEG